MGVSFSRKYLSHWKMRSCKAIHPVLDLNTVHQRQRYAASVGQKCRLIGGIILCLLCASNVGVGCRSRRRDLHLHAECVFLFTNKFIGRREAFSCIRRMGLIWNPLSSGLYPECCQPSCCIQLTVEAAAAKEESVGE